MKSSHAPKLCATTLNSSVRLLGTQSLYLLPAGNHSQLPCATRTHSIRKDQMSVKRNFAGTIPGVWVGGGGGEKDKKPHVICLPRWRS